VLEAASSTQGKAQDLSKKMAPNARSELPGCWVRHKQRRTRSPSAPDTRKGKKNPSCERRNCPNHPETSIKAFGSACERTGNLKPKEPKKGRALFQKKQITTEKTYSRALPPQRLLNISGGHIWTRKGTQAVNNQKRSIEDRQQLSKGRPGKPNHFKGDPPWGKGNSSTFNSKAGK